MLVALGAVVVLAGCRPAENPLQGNATNSAIPAPPKPATNAASPAATNSAPEWMASVDEVNRAIDARNWDDASARIANAEKLVPAEHRGVFIVPQFKILLGKKEYAAAYEFAARISAATSRTTLTSAAPSAGRWSACPSTR